MAPQQPVSPAVGVAATLSFTGGSKTKEPPPLEVPGPTMTLEQAIADDSFVRWDCPFAPQDQRKTRKLRQRLGHPPQEVQPPSQQVLDVVQRFIPSREWTEPSDGTLWRQNASTESASRLDSVMLQEMLDRKLFDERARATGVCPIRQRLYRECFDELLRQVAAESPERGILLLKVRHERECTISAYREILESRSGYAFRTALKGDKDTYIMQTRIAELKRRKQQLIEEEERLKDEEKQVRAEGEEQNRDDEKRRKDELGQLLKEAQLKKAQLEAITALPRK